MQQEKSRRWRWVVATALLGFFAAAAVSVLSIEPTLAALACPPCFGFERLSGEVFVESASSDQERAQLADVLRTGEEKVAEFFGGLRETPRILVCTTDTCTKRLGMRGAKGVSYGCVGIRLAPSGVDDIIVAHERCHVELHGRLGGWYFLGAVPTWFDEGLAVIVSDDPRYLRPKGEGDRCRQATTSGLPVSASEWGRAAGGDHDLYARAACRVSRWMDANGGQSAVLVLLAELAAGKSFDRLYRDPP